jgi:hypothetical protein
MLPDRIELESDTGRVTYVLRRDLAPATYEIEGSGVLATATGAVWVRFEDGVNAAERSESFARAGYRIERVPAYAPNAVLVRGEDVGAGLENLARLREIPGVVHVEPEMLMERTFRE